MMLPEQATRLYNRDLLGSRNAFQVARQQGMAFHLTRFKMREWLRRKDDDLSAFPDTNLPPETLTGDAWRTAWADAHDAETQEALNAIY